MNPLAAVQEGYDFAQGIRDRRTMNNAGNALAGGDYRGGANALLQGGMLNEGSQLLAYDQKRQAFDAEQEAAQKKAAAEARVQKFSTLGRGVEAMKRGAPWAQVRQTLLQLDPDLKDVVGMVDQHLGPNQAQPTPEQLDQFEALLGKETDKARFQLVNQEGLGVGSFDTRTGETNLQYRTPPKPLVLGEGQIAYEGDPSVPTGAQGGPAMGGAPNVDALFQSLIKVESGGRAGILGPQTPYGQAQGMTQMLPGTAQEMAAKLGVPWQPELMTGNTPEAAQYQQTLGRAYLEEGLQKYGGDPRRALMYYHGGPNEALWGPKTRAYADKVLGGAGQAQPGGRRVVAQGAPKARGARPATAAELAAYGIPPGTPAQISADGKIDVLNVPGSKPMPVGMQTAEDNDLTALESADTINQQITGFIGQIDSGKLNFGPVANLISEGRLKAGMADESARNFGSFKAGMERLRNDSLRLNAGVQTDGDAQRAWNELFSNINDEKFVRQRLVEIAALNRKAIASKQAKIDLRRSRNGAEPLFGGAPAPRTAPKPAPRPASAPQKPAQGLAFGGRPVTPAEAKRLPKGARFKGTDGKVYTRQ
jgi:hypothetical protein